MRHRGAGNKKVKIKIERTVSKAKRVAGGKKNKKEAAIQGVSELRQDIITGDWVIIATGRAKRPEDFSLNERQNADRGAEDCLFCDPNKSGQEKDVLIYEKADGEWTLRVFPNKYPYLKKDVVLSPISEGPFFAMSGFGSSEVVVTRDHDRQIALFDQLEIAEVLDAYQERYLALMSLKNINFIAIFHNNGIEAGGTIAHPHTQILAVPVLAPSFKMELDGAERYYRNYRHCVYCLIAEYESEQQKRVVFENEDFIALCPFASRAAFEIWVMPKKHSPYFERITDGQKMSLAEVFQKALRAIHKALNDPAYNFYIHTSPCDGKDYPHFHWHIEILPHTSTWAGFEMETGIEISTIQPEAAAEYLRKQL